MARKNWLLLTWLAMLTLGGCTGAPAPPTRPSPTLIPSAVPTAGVIADALVFQSTHNWRDAGGAYHIMGEVVNQGPYPFKRVTVTAWLADGADQTVAEAYDELDLLVIMPGQAVPFHVLLYGERVAAAYHYKLWAAGEGVDLASTAITHQVELLGVPNFPPDGSLRFDGMATNTGPHPLDYVAVTIALLDAQNRVVGVGSEIVSGPLAAGAVMIFSHTFYPTDLAGGAVEAVAGYRLAGEGWRSAEN
ncbi:MAG: hypothetical protein JXB47_12935 [Anaerolineae bacterium]|nr:hypothetical protein [Anaerolineae bacterium]